MGDVPGGGKHLSNTDQGEELGREPLAVYTRLHHRARDAARRGEASFAFPELAPTVARMQRHLRELRRTLPESRSHGDEPDLLELEARADALLARGTPYPELLELTLGYVEAVERRVRAGHSGLADVFVPRCREELEPLRHLWPEVLVFPTFSELDRRHFWRTRSVPLHALGLLPCPRYVDGQLCSPAEYFFHDIDHVRFLVREELLARGFDIPDVYRSADPYSPASTFDSVRGRHRTLLPAAAEALKEHGPGKGERLAEHTGLARRLDTLLLELRAEDEALSEAAGWLLFELVHEKGFPMDPQALRAQLTQERHPVKLGAKFAAGFYGEGAVSVEVPPRLEEAWGWLARQVRACG